MHYEVNANINNRKMDDGKSLGFVATVIIGVIFQVERISKISIYLVEGI